MTTMMLLNQRVSLNMKVYAGNKTSAQTKINDLS
jgi:hypothetical protein